MKIVNKTVFMTEDGKAHDTRQEAEDWVDYCTIRAAIESYDLDWRDGVGQYAATPDKIADLLTAQFKFTPRHPAAAPD